MPQQSYGTPYRTISFLLRIISINLSGYKLAKLELCVCACMCVLGKEEENGRMWKTVKRNCQFYKISEVCSKKRRVESASKWSKALTDSLLYQYPDLVSKSGFKKVKQLKKEKERCLLHQPLQLHQRGKLPFDLLSHLLMTCSRRLDGFSH